MDTVVMRMSTNGYGDRATPEYPEGSASGGPKGVLDHPLNRRDAGLDKLSMHAQLDLAQMESPNAEFRFAARSLRRASRHGGPLPQWTQEPHGLSSRTPDANKAGSSLNESLTEHSRFALAQVFHGNHHFVNLPGTVRGN
jgi:hypothetical protein